MVLNPSTKKHQTSCFFATRLNNVEDFLRTFCILKLISITNKARNMIAAADKSKEYFKINVHCIMQLKLIVQNELN